MPPAPKTAVILNPAAAGGRLGKRVGQWTDAFHAYLGAYELFMTRRPGHATELARQALLSGCDRIVSVGGDGTHCETANGFFSERRLIRPESHLAIVPYGTGTDFSRTLGIPRGLAALDRIPRARIVRIDAGCATFQSPSGEAGMRHFLNIADFGAGGEVVRRVNQTSKYCGGFPSFLYGVVSTLITFRNPWVHIQIDDVVLEGAFNNVIIANGQYYGGGMHAAPHARLDSGLFEVYLIGDVRRIEALVNLPKLYRGRLDRAGKVRHFCAKRIIARAETAVLLNLDGEQPGRLPATFEILPRALPVLV